MRKVCLGEDMGRGYGERKLFIDVLVGGIVEDDFDLEIWELYGWLGLR